MGTTLLVFNAYRVRALTFPISSSNAHLPLWTEIPSPLSWTSYWPWFVQNVPTLTLTKESPYLMSIEIFSCHCFHNHMVSLVKAVPALSQWCLSLPCAGSVLWPLPSLSGRVLGSRVPAHTHRHSSLARGTGENDFQLQSNPVQKLAIFNRFGGWQDG